jgi:hypothetical protein
MTDPASFNARTIAEFHANHGRVGGGFAEQSRRYSGFARYQSRTEWVIPVFALTPTGEVGASALSTSA